MTNTPTKRERNFILFVLYLGAIFCVAAAIATIAPSPAHAQATVGVYTEDTGNVRNRTGTTNRGSPVANPTDGSGTITASNTSQQVFAADPLRVFLSCQNPLDATEPLYINVGTAVTATNGYGLAAGSTFSNPADVNLTGSVHVMAATAGHRFVCKSGR